MAEPRFNLGPTGHRESALPPDHGDPPRSLKVYYFNNVLQLFLETVLYQSSHYFQYRQCPLKHKPENVESSQMFATALAKGTLTIPTKKFQFNQTLFISIFILPDDTKCHLPGWQNTVKNLMFERHKLVSVKLTIVDFKGYDMAVTVLVGSIFTVSILGCVMFCRKLYGFKSFCLSLKNDLKMVSLENFLKMFNCRTGNTCLSSAEYCIGLPLPWSKKWWPLNGS